MERLMEFYTRKITRNDCFGKRKLAAILMMPFINTDIRDLII